MVKGAPMIGKKQLVSRSEIGQVGVTPRARNCAFACPPESVFFPRAKFCLTTGVHAKNEVQETNKDYGPGLKFVRRNEFPSGHN
jgi:hypothetical protein